MIPPLVSVIVPRFNHGRYVPDALDSVLAQTYPHWECIIVNDGSKDNSREVALDYVSRDSRIRYVEQENRGLAAARNRGLQEMRGTHVQFLDSDDSIASEKFQLQLSAAAGVKDLCVVYCDHYYASADDIAKDLRLDFPMPRFVLSNPLWDIAVRWETELSIPVHSFLFDARIFRDCGIRFSEALPNHEDWDCWMRVLALRITIKHVAAKLAAYRVRPQSMSRRDDYMMWKGFSTAIQQQKQLWRHDPHVAKLLADKRVQTDVRYGHSRNPLRAMLMTLTRSAFFRQYFPWPGQKLVYRMLGRKV